MMCRCPLYAAACKGVDSASPYVASTDEICVVRNKRTRGKRPFEQFKCKENKEDKPRYKNDIFRRKKK